MGSDRGDGIAVGGAVLDLKPFHGIGIITPPGLGRIVEHPCIVPAAAAGAGFKQKIGEIRDQPFIQAVHPEDVFMIDPPLPGRIPSCAVAFADGTVHVPFDIVDGSLLNNGMHPLIKIIHHLGLRHIKHHLMPSQGRIPLRRGQCPVGIPSVEIAVGVYHFRLKPEAELKSHIVDLVRKAFYALRKLVRIYKPVTEPGRIIVSCAKPPVVKNEQLYTGLSALLCYLKDRLLCKAHFGGFPVI